MLVGNMATAPTEAEMESQRQIQRLEAELAEMRQREENLRNQILQRQLPKRKEPAVWDGVGDMKTNFEVPVRTWLNHYGAVDQPVGVSYATDYLPPIYKSQLQLYLENDANPPPQNFAALCVLVRRWHPEPDRKLAAWDKLLVLKQRPGQLAEYTHEFNKLMLDVIQVVSPWPLRHRYLKGLTLELQAAISGKFELDTCDLQDIVNQATAAESREMSRTGGTSAAGPLITPSIVNSSGVTGPSDHSGASPMELNAVQTFRGVCHNCGKTGHRWRWCPELRREGIGSGMRGKQPAHGASSSQSK